MWRSAHILTFAKLSRKTLAIRHTVVKTEWVMSAWNTGYFIWSILIHCLITLTKFIYGGVLIALLLTKNIKNFIFFILFLKVFDYLLAGKCFEECVTSLLPGI